MPKSRKTKKGPSGNSNGGALVASSILPQLVSFPIFRTGHLRYRCAAATTTIITAATLAGLYASGVAGTTVVRLVGAIKIKRIRMIDNGGLPIFLQWLGANGIQSTAELQSVGMAGASPSVIDSQPPVGSAASFWQLCTGANNMFELTGNAVTSGVGTYVDVWFDWCLAQSTSTTTLNSALAATNVVTLPLDGAGASPVYPSESTNAAS